LIQTELSNEGNQAEHSLTEMVQIEFEESKEHEQAMIDSSRFGGWIILIQIKRWRFRKL